MRRIAIVDDERSLRESFSLYLEEQGYVVNTFENPLGILKECATCFVQEDPYCEVIFVDYNMPSMTGLEFLEKTNNICRLSSNRKFLVSGALNCQIISKTKKLGAEPVHKPLSLNALDQLVSSAKKQVHRSIDESTTNVKRKLTNDVNRSQTEAQDKIKSPTENPFNRSTHSIISTHINTEEEGQDSCKHIRLCGGVFRGELLRLEIPGLCLDYGVYNIETSATDRGAENCYVVGLVLDCESETTCFQQELSFGDLVYLPPQTEQDVIVGGKTIWCTLTFNKEQFEIAYRQHLRASTAARPIDQSAVIEKNPATIKLARLIRRLLLSDQRSMLKSTSLCANDELTQNFLKTSINAIFRNQESSTDKTTKIHAKIVAAAEDYLNSLGMEPVKVIDLARELSVSVRRLQYTFQSIFGITPKRYLKIRRLNFVRQKLLRGPEKTISHYATQAGFWHMSQFTQDYKGLFGETPKETIQKINQENKG